MKKIIKKALPGNYFIKSGLYNKEILYSFPIKVSLYNVLQGQRGFFTFT